MGCNQENLDVLKTAVCASSDSARSELMQRSSSSSFAALDYKPVEKTFKPKTFEEADAALQEEVQRVMKNKDYVPRTQEPCPTCGLYQYIFAAWWVLVMPFAAGVMSYHLINVRS